MWHHASIRGIICNLTYTGVLRSGESRSQTLPHLQIIEQELFELHSTFVPPVPTPPNRNGVYR